MNEFVENLKKDLAELSRKAKELLAKVTGKPIGVTGDKKNSLVSTTTENTYEINLVPEVKAQMIRALKIRNRVFFACILVSAIALGSVLVLLGIKGGQDIALANQDKKIETMSKKLNSYSELNDLVIIQDQLERYDDISAKKTVLSRVFGALGVALTQGSDFVRMSELRVNLQNNQINMEAQADAKVEPLIDYRVLEAFKKSMDLTKYDYGRYVDVDGKELPTQCMTEADKNGNALRDGDSYYAWWNVTIPGCEGAERSLDAGYTDTEYHYSANADVEMGIKTADGTVVEKVPDLIMTNPNAQEGENATEVIKVEGEEVPMRVRIWRTPQFNEWYGRGEMNLNGVVTGIEHFESKCYKYLGTEIEKIGYTGIGEKKEVHWTSTNECLLAPDGLTVTSSSNGRDESDNLVLKFTANVKFSEAFFAFSNKHMIAIGPMGQNVTDSYMQIGNMFAQEATSCEPDDKDCLNNSGSGS